ncbi:MAG: twin-arginine translocase TatA/TatE family subunit [Kiritimatiellales bacterium]
MVPAITAFISPGGGELILIMLVLIMLFGAKDAPRILRSIQSTLDKMQRAAADFRYRIMYGDLHQNASSSIPTKEEEPYDVEADYPDDEKNAPEPGKPDATPEKPEPRTEDS